MHPKVKATGLAGAVSVIVVAVFDVVGAKVSPELAAAISTVISFGAGYLKS